MFVVRREGNVFTCVCPSIHPSICLSTGGRGVPWSGPAGGGGVTQSGPARGVPYQGIPSGGGYPTRGATLTGGPTRGVPPARSKWGIPWGVPQLGHQKEYLICHGRYASCFHAGGLSCGSYFYCLHLKVGGRKCFTGVCLWKGGRRWSAHLLSRSCLGWEGPPVQGKRGTPRQDQGLPPNRNRVWFVMLQAIRLLRSRRRTFLSVMQFYVPQSKTFLKFAKLFLSLKSCFNFLSNAFRHHFNNLGMNNSISLDFNFSISSEEDFINTR